MAILIPSLRTCDIIYTFLIVRSLHVVFCGTKTINTENSLTMIAKWYPSEKEKKRTLKRLFSVLINQTLNTRWDHSLSTCLFID